MSLIEPSAMRKNWEIEWDQLDGPEYAAYFDAQFGEATKTRSGSFLLLPRALQKQKTAAHLRWALTKPDSHNTGSEIGGTPHGHRALKYVSNNEGHEVLKTDLAKRLSTIINGK